MIKDNTIDQALIEIMRCKKALETLRKARKGKTKRCWRSACELYQADQPRERTKCAECNGPLYEHGSEVAPHSAAKRASLDLTRVLADLRQGR
jgi:hypothetical protein